MNYRFNLITAPLTAVVLTALMAVGTAYVATDVLSNYGAGLFVVTPITCGAFAVVFYHLGRTPTFFRSLGLSSIAGCISLIFFLLLGQEGAICLVMAAPLTLPLFMLGGVLGHFASLLQKKRSSHVVTCALLLLVAPLISGFEGKQVKPGHAFPIETTVLIHSTRECVWKHVIAFQPIPAPDEWFFRAGIAYPIKARIDGRGVGALRYCEFTTGDFVEPITVWEEGRRLAFDVREQPDPMIERSPYGVIHPPHLDWAIQSRRGEFRIEEAPGGGFELRGTTWVSVHMKPEWYWAPIVEHLIHKIHGRVLTHIKRCAEAETAAPFR